MVEEPVDIVVASGFQGEFLIHLKLVETWRVMGKEEEEEEGE